MWIADGWKDYEVIEAGALGRLSFGKTGSSGNLGHKQSSQRLENYEWSLSPQQKRRRRVGIF